MTPTNLYSIFDRKAARYAPPFVADNDGIAQRNLIQALQQPSQLTQFPEDFSLIILATMEMENGVIQPLEVPRIVCTVQQCLQMAGSGAPGAVATPPPSIQEALRVSANGSK